MFVLSFGAMDRMHTQLSRWSIAVEFEGTVSGGARRSAIESRFEVLNALNFLAHANKSHFAQLLVFSGLSRQHSHQLPLSIGV